MQKKRKTYHPGKNYFAKKHRNKKVNTFGKKKLSALNILQDACYTAWKLCI